MSGRNIMKHFINVVFAGVLCLIFSVFANNKTVYVNNIHKADYTRTTYRLD